jgi:hypothetical protein
MNKVDLVPLWEMSCGTEVAAPRLNKCRQILLNILDLCLSLHHSASLFNIWRHISPFERRAKINSSLSIPGNKDDNKPREVFDKTLYGRVVKGC